MSIQTTQAELDDIFRRMSKDYGALNKKQQAYAIKEIGRIRSEVNDLLADYADDDGIISRRRANMVIRELDGIEKSIRKNGEIIFEEIASDTSDWTTNRIAKISGVTISGAATERVNKHVVKYIAKRFGDDGLVLSDRVWGLGADIREEISSVIRSNIIRGEGIQKMIPEIRKVYDNETWKIRRLARTEGVTAHRAATSYNAVESDLVEYVQFHDGGPDKNHENHACYDLANRDPYGKGRGVYKPNDTEIWMPHPQCTSYISYILDERWL